MRYLTVSEVIELYRQVMDASGGTVGILSMEALESAVAQPRASFDATDLYATIIEKASSLCYSLVMNHPFVDGNKRVGHYAMETFLVINGYELDSSVDAQETIILQLASGKIDRDTFTDWIREHIRLME
ncbi:MAG TPA: type II toxin-antitoxin system death-on-curing family toxin [Anaerolineales bacterium]|nr:type II toxin-antitoxin system death-on-curing family toxin [Anaerolineales bacterium]